MVSGDMATPGQPKICLFALFFIGIWSIGKFDDSNNVVNEPEPEWLYYVDEAGNTHVMNFSSLPDSRKDMIYGDVYFSLYTRNNTDTPELLTIPNDNTQLNSTYFDDLNPVVVIAHGWMSDDRLKWVQDMKDSFLKKAEFNVITVNWEELAKNPVYPLSALSTRYVGKKLAKLLDGITRSYCVNGKDMYLVGHSLGAQIMGYAGMFSNSRIQRITGLDAARPLFEVPLMPADFRLEKSDAEFVDIIHTCGGVFGYKSSNGHADFYPNNGTLPQPGCEGITQIIQACSHSRAYVYFEESIGYALGQGFLAYPCQNWDQGNEECKNNARFMGYPAIGSSGDYYLRTRNEPPYAIY